MMQDDRTNAQAAAGLLQAPTSVIDQMDERHGKFGSRLGLFGHLMGGGEKSTYGDEDLQAQYKQDKAAYDTQQARNLLGQQFVGLDMNDLSMADVATISQLDEGLGKLALENYTFGQRVGDLGRAQEFLNDGVDDEHDLWATEVFGRYGKTADGQDTTLDRVAKAAGMTTDQFTNLSTEMQEAYMYQHGGEGYREASDRLGNRKTLAQIEDEAQATQQGDAIGKLDGSSIEYMHNASSVDFDQNIAMENADSIISMLNNDEISTGKWQKWFKDTTGITTRADGTLSAAATENLIAQINRATFGALSENEMNQLKQTFAEGGQTKEFNLGVMETVKKKLDTAREKHTRDTQRAVDRIKDNNPEEYERFMRDDDNYLRYGGGSNRENIGNQDFSSFYRKGIEKGLSRDQIDIQWNETRKMTEEAEAERQRIAAEEAKLAEQARKEMQASGQHLSPYIRRQ